MPKIQFCYWSHQAEPSAAFPQGWSSRRPLATISLTNGANRFSCVGLVDSGADYCLFPASFMAPLGIDPLLTPTDRCTGVAGIAVTHFHEVVIEVPNLTKLSVYVGFSDGMEQWGMGLLGHRGFLDQLRVGFLAEYFEIETL